jgi:hypothetical protein
MQIKIIIKKQNSNIADDPSGKLMLLVMGTGTVIRAEQSNPLFVHR